MAAIGGEDSLRVGLFGASASNTMGDLGGAFAGLLIDAVTFDDKSLSNMRKVYVVVEFGGDPDLAGFNAPMVRRGKIDVIWFLPILEVELDVFKERGLVSLDGEVIVSLTVLD